LVIDLMVERKVLTLQWGDLSLQLHPIALQPPLTAETPRNKMPLIDADGANPLREKVNGEDLDEDLLFASSGG
jgi:hypothetical protein